MVLNVFDVLVGAALVTMPPFDSTHLNATTVPCYRWKLYFGRVVPLYITST